MAAHTSAEVRSVQEIEVDGFFVVGFLDGAEVGLVLLGAGVAGAVVTGDVVAGAVVTGDRVVGEGVTGDWVVVGTAREYLTDPALYKEIAQLCCECWYSSISVHVSCFNLQ